MILHPLSFRYTNIPGSIFIMSFFPTGHFAHVCFPRKLIILTFNSRLSVQRLCQFIRQTAHNSN